MPSPGHQLLEALPACKTPVPSRCPSAGGLDLLQGLARGWGGWWELWVPMEPSHPPRSPPPRSLIVRGTASVKSV